MPEANLHDPRVTPARPGLAAEFLRGLVEAEHYTPGEGRQVRVGLAPLRSLPSEAAELSSQLLFGQKVTLYDDQDGWAWVQNESDGYVGYVPSAALSDGLLDDLFSPTHKVGVPAAFVFSEPNVKSNPIDQLPMGALVSAVFAQSQGFAPLAGGGWIYAAGLRALEDYSADYGATAMSFMGAPYLWGGKSWQGMDCSGLVQVALDRAGVDVPRDSDQQRDALSLMGCVEIEPDPAALLGGDIVFFPGHVGIMVDDLTLVHANAHHMMVTLDPIRQVIARGSPLTGVRRF